MSKIDIRNEDKFSLVNRFTNDEGLNSILFYNSYEGDFDGVEKEVRKMFVCTDEQLQFLNLNFCFPDLTKGELVEYNNREPEDFPF